MAGMSEEKLGYERLGAKRLRLVDCISQSVGFMGPVFSAAFLIPLIAGVSASGKGAGIATPLAVLIAAIGTFALGWIVAQYAKRVHAAGSLYDYVSNGLGSRAGAFAGWIYYGGTTVLASAIACLVGLVRPRRDLHGRPGGAGRDLVDVAAADVGMESHLRGGGLPGAVPRGAHLDAGATDPGARIGRRGPRVLHQGDRGRAATRTSSRSSRAPPPTAGAASCSASCTAC